MLNAAINTLMSIQSATLRKFVIAALAILLIVIVSTMFSPAKATVTVDVYSGWEITTYEGDDVACVQADDYGSDPLVYASSLGYDYPHKTGVGHDRDTQFNYGWIVFSDNPIWESSTTTLLVGLNAEDYPKPAMCVLVLSMLTGEPS